MINTVMGAKTCMQNKKIILLLLSSVPFLMVLGNSMLIPEFDTIKTVPAVYPFWLESWVFAILKNKNNTLREISLSACFVFFTA